MTTYNKSRIIPIILCMLLCMMFLLGGVPARAYAATSKYTSAITDLEKDEAFNEADYPDNAKDYTIRVIQIAESTDGELFVYTYQPCQKTTYLVATEINMSPTASIEDTKLYSLTLINSSGVFCKYRVNDLSVKPEQVRYYNITSISRQWIKDIDKPTGSDNTASTVPYTVAQKWTAVTTSDGKVEYYCTKNDVIEITDKYVGFLRYWNGFKFLPDSCDSHYVAFSTDIPIEYLYDADVEFECVLYFMGVLVDKDPKKETVTLSDMDTASNKADGWFAEKHEWNRIESVETFMANEELTDSAKTNLRNKQWVLRFKETSCLRQQGRDSYTAITDVSILRLKFKSNGVVYDIGVVDNKQSGTTTPGNTDTSWLPDWIVNAGAWLKNNWQWLAIGAVGIVVLIIIMPFMPLILQAIVTLFTWLFKGLWWLLSAPFKWLYHKIKGDGSGT